MTARVAVVIVNFRTPDMALAAARALAGERAVNPGLRVMIVDGGSGDGSAERLAEGLGDPALVDWVSVVPLAINGGFGWANNQGMLRLLQSDAPPDYIHLLNPDTVVEPGAVSALREALDADPRCGAVGSLLLNDDGSPSGSAFSFMSVGSEFARGLRTDAIRRRLGIAPSMIEQAGVVDWATGASIMLRADALRQAGMFDTGFFLYFEEVELCWRLRQAGWSVRHEPRSRVRHVGGVSTGIDYGRDHAEQRPALPRYWFASRRRMFARTIGSAGAVAAGIAWLIGHGLYLMRSAARIGKRQRLNRHEARDLLAYGLIPDAVDLSPCVTRCDDALGQPPGWMCRT